MAAAIASVRDYLAALEAFAAADTRDPALWNAEQAAYRALNIDGARHLAQQRWTTRPTAPPTPAPPTPASAPRRPAVNPATAPERPARPTPPPDPLHPGLLR